MRMFKINEEEYKQNEYFYKRMEQLHPGTVTIDTNAPPRRKRPTTKAKRPKEIVLPIVEKPPTYITAKEAAEILGRHSATIVGWLKKGKLEGEKKKNRWLVLKKSVENCLSLMTEAILPPTEEELPTHITVKEASNILEKHYKTIINWLNNGRLKGKKNGSRWMVLKESVDNYSPPKRKWKKGTDPKQRLKALERDNYTCQKCGATENLEVHHKIPRHRGGTDKLDNLITECMYCHADEHKDEPIYALMASRFSPMQKVMLTHF